MNLILGIAGPDKDREEFLDILEKLNVTVRVHEVEKGEKRFQLYEIDGDYEMIERKIKRNAGAKRKRKYVSIQTIIDTVPAPYKNPPKRRKVLEELGLSERNYMRIKKNLCKKYTSLEKAIEAGETEFK